jgi:hypothetical protein
VLLDCSLRVPPLKDHLDGQEKKVGKQLERGREQGDLIGRIFACWVIVDFGQFFILIRKFN